MKPMKKLCQNLGPISHYIWQVGLKPFFSLSAFWSKQRELLCRLSVVFLLPIRMTTESTGMPANKNTYLYILPKIKQKRKVFDLWKSMHLFSFSFWLTLQTIGGGWLLFLDWKLLYFWPSYFLTTLQGLGNQYLYFLI